MNWIHIPVIEYGEDVEIYCSVCGEKQDDIIYIPNHLSEEQAKEIESLFNVDPFTDFRVCEDCMDGHCGAVPGLNANNWLEKQSNRQSAPSWCG